jgi:hypothetical protein
MHAVAGSRTHAPAFGQAVATLLFSLSSLLVSLPAAAVIIDSGDGTGNTSAPPDDPGWDNVGVLGGATVVYLRNGWVLTAAHVGLGDVSLGGTVYAAVPDSDTQIADGLGTLADLVVFAITPIPPLPDLEIRANTALPPGEVIMLGHGRNRGAASDSDDSGIWTPPPDHPSPPVEGWYRTASKTQRWGTNKVEDYWDFSPIDTESFYTLFEGVGEPGHTPHECQAANGDSGGALFAKDGGNWELAGLMWAIAPFQGQNPNTSALRGNATLAADLSFYRDEIVSLTATPVPEPALVLQLITGAGFLAVVNRSRGCSRA